MMVEDAFANLVRIVDAVSLEGASRFMERRMIERFSCNETLSTLSTPPLNAAAGELIVRKIFQGFASGALALFQEIIMNGAEIVALRTLHDDYRRTLLLLDDWCKRLQLSDLSAKFSVSMRCHILQPDLLTGESPAGKDELMAFLREHGRRVLADMSDSETEGGRSVVRGVLGYRDEVLERLHGLTLSSTSDLKTLWKAVLVECVRERVRDLDDDFSTERIHAYVQWKNEVVDAFVRMALSPGPDNADVRAEVDRWCEELEQLLLVSYSRKRIANFWDVVVEYPDSMPTLRDLRYCFVHSSDDTIRNELIQTAKHMLASRLHRAGTRTEDILAILIGTIHSLCILFSKNEQGSIMFTIVGDTLEHLKKRKDCVAAVVQAITQPSADSVLYADLHTSACSATDDRRERQRNSKSEDGGMKAGRRRDNGYDRDDDDNDDNDDNDNDEEELIYLGVGARVGRALDHDETPLATHEKPDVLRVLLSSISVPSIVEEYRQVLASQLLSKPMHDFNTAAEEEVLERLKCAFGEDVLTPCMVMIRDFQASRRHTQHLSEAYRRRHALSGQSHDWPLSLNVISTASWPKLTSCLPVGETVPVPENFNPHPLLRVAMKEATEEFQAMKTNQRLEWILSQGTVSLELKQRIASTNEVVQVTHELSLFSASIVLYVRDVAAQTGSDAPLEIVAERIGVKPSSLPQRLSHLFPSVLVYSDERKSFSVQTNHVSSSTFTFDETEYNDEQPSGLSQDEVKMLHSMMIAMLKANGPRGANDIYNSMKMFCKFKGTLEDMKKLLQMFLVQGKLALNEAKLFTLPKS